MSIGETMRTVHKYELTLGTTTLHLPTDAKCLHVGNQFENICLWVEIDSNCLDFENRDFRVFGTGHPIDEFVGMEITYVGTAILQGGNFVAHVYQGKAEQCYNKNAPRCEIKGRQSYAKSPHEELA